MITAAEARKLVKTEEELIVKGVELVTTQLDKAIKDACEGGNTGYSAMIGGSIKDTIETNLIELGYDVEFGELDDNGNCAITVKWEE